MDIREFKIKVLPLKDRLFRLAKRLLEDPDDAEDAVQEVFIKIWNRKEKMDEYSSVEAFAVVTTRNHCLDILRSKKQDEISLEVLPNSQKEMTAGEGPGYEEIIATVNRMIKDLPEMQKTILHLRDIEGYEFTRIAEITGLSENAIRVALSRARGAVREILKNKSIYDIKRN